MLLTRIAPTPSGYLHLGNVFSFALTWLLARSQGGRVYLRIDDLDGERFRHKYLEDIFQTLEWLKIDWDLGPQSPEDFLTNHSQRLRLSDYLSHIDKLRPYCFPCACSRNHPLLSETGHHLCPQQPPTELPYALRIKNPEEPIRFTDLILGNQEIDLTERMSEFVLVTKSGMPCYQIASLCDDVGMGASLIVRGEDLLASTAAQLYLAKLLGFESFQKSLFVHHSLLRDQKGGKLSKSAGSVSIAYMKKNGIRVKEIVGYFASWAGIDKKPLSFKELVGDPIFEIKPINIAN